MYPQTSIHAHIFARSISTHLCASAKTYTCIQNNKCIHRHFTQRTYTHRYTHTLTHAHEYASALRISSALRIYRPIHMNIHLCTRIYVCAHTSMNNKHQHVRAQTDIQTCMHALNHSRSHIYIRECVPTRVWLYCVVSVCLCMHVYECNEYLYFRVNMYVVRIRVRLCVFVVIVCESVRVCDYEWMCDCACELV